MAFEGYEREYTTLLGDISRKLTVVIPALAGGQSRLDRSYPVHTTGTEGSLWLTCFSAAEGFARIYTLSLRKGRLGGRKLRSLAST
jgi:hypothetical protein